MYWIKLRTFAAQFYCPEGGPEGSKVSEKIESNNHF